MRRTATRRCLAMLVLAIVFVQVAPASVALATEAVEPGPAFTMVDPPIDSMGDEQAARPAPGQGALAALDAWIARLAGSGASAAFALPSAEPTIPTGLDGLALNGLVLLVWDDDPGAAFFRVYRKQSTESSYAVLGQTPEAIYIDDTVQNEFAYDYCVSAVSSVGVETGKSPPIRLDPETAPVIRLAGEDRYDTAVRICQWDFYDADKAVLASGAGFADALSASSLCGLYGAPLLLTEPDEVPAIVMDELARLGVSHVFIVGGEGAVSGEVQTQLTSAGYGVTRLGGANRYHTSALVARHVVGNGGHTFAAFICRGDDFADALAASPFAYVHAAPILLVADGYVPAETQAAMRDLSRDTIWVIGGHAVLPDARLWELWGPGGKPTVVYGGRLWGQDRYYTSVAVVQRFQEGRTYLMLGVATGEDYADALAGGVACGNNYGALLLSARDGVNLGVKALTDRYREHLWEVQVFGGKSALSDRVADQLGAILD